MKGIRVLLGCPGLKSLDVWRSALAQQPDIELVGEAVDPIDILLRAGASKADVVVIDLPPAQREPGLPSHLLAEYPRIKVLGVSPDGDCTVVYSMGIVRQEIQAISPQTITQLIRTLPAESM